MTAEDPLPEDPRLAALSLPTVPLGVAPNGARRSPADHSALPIRATELAATARACAAAGASWFHVHVRDEDGRHTLDAGRYREAFAAIREAVGDALVLQMSTESVGLYAPDEQMAAVRELRPEAVSLAVRELLAGDVSEPDLIRFVGELAEQGTAVQFIVYEPAVDNASLVGQLVEALAAIGLRPASVAETRRRFGLGTAVVAG